MIKPYNKITFSIGLTLIFLMNSSALKADCSQLELIYDYPYTEPSTSMSIDYQQCGHPRGMRSNYKPHKDSFVPVGIETGSDVCIGDADWSYCAPGGKFKMPPGDHKIVCGSSGPRGPGGRWMECKLK